MKLLTLFIIAKLAHLVSQLCGLNPAIAFCLGFFSTAVFLFVVDGYGLFLMSGTQKWISLGLLVVVGTTAGMISTGLHERLK